jgi:hypothetical protein
LKATPETDFEAIALWIYLTVITGLSPRGNMGTHFYMAIAITIAGERLQAILVRLYGGTSAQTSLHPN